MRKLLNTLYVTTQGTYLHREGETLVVEKDRQKLLQLPIHTLQGLVCFGNVLCSPFLLGFCAERGVTVSFLTESGRFLASVHGPISGNVLLRKEQYRQSEDPVATTKVARAVVAAKLSNSRVVLARSLRDHGDRMDRQSVEAAVGDIDGLVDGLVRVESVDEVRGIEGLAAAKYFSVLGNLILEQPTEFVFRGRSRRPPLDAVNAMLSFLYTLLAHDVRSALESVGLDPAVGFLHRDRPGRPSLALDLMEEFRAVIADRLVLSLINRRQVKSGGFLVAESGAVTMDADTRKVVLVEYQNRKQDEILHPFLDEKIPIGLLFFVQAFLMARFLRGDLDGYPPFFWR